MNKEIFENIEQAIRKDKATTTLFGLSQDKETNLFLVTELANTLGLDRVKTGGAYFDRDYVRGSDGAMRLKTEKAVVRALGKTTKVTLKEGQDYETVAAEVTEKWREYFKVKRQVYKERARLPSRQRQQAKRDREKQAETEFRRRD